MHKYDADGLAFQRYSRVSQQGAGDDILAGNSLSIVGLYKAIYGINPQFNRLYLDPHLPAKLSGTELIYNFRHDKLKIGLETDHYSISNDQYKITSKSDFGYYSDRDELYYFNGEDDSYSLKANTAESLLLEILVWDPVEYSWLQSSAGDHGKVFYTINVKSANTLYTIFDGYRNWFVKSDRKGFLKFEVKTTKTTIPLNIRLKK